MFQYQDFEASGNPILIKNETTALPPPIINELHIYGGSYQNKLTGSQLLDGSKIEIGGLSGTQGGPFDTKNRARIQNIKVEPGKNYTISGINSTYSIANTHVFNADGLRISSLLFDSSVVPDNAVSASISFSKKDSTEMTDNDIEILKNSVMLNEGTVIKPFEPYTGGKTSPSIEIPAEIINKGKNGSIKVEVTGRNLWDKSKLSGGELVNFNGVECYKYLDGNAPFNFDLSWNKSTNPFTLTVRVFRDESHATKEMFFKFIYDDGFIEHVKLSIGVINTKTSRDGKILKRITGSNNYNVNVYIDLSVTQLEYGTTPTPYEPYTHQSLTLATPNGLPGIPVTKDGNYTDKDGQQWVCDEIDLTKKKYVQRVKDFIITQDTRILTSMGAYGAPEKDSILARYLDRAIKKSGAILCRELIHIPNWKFDSESVHTTETSIDFRVSRKRLGLGTETTDDENKTAVLKFLETTPLHCLVELATPIERDLTPEEIAAYKSIITHNDTTVVSNNENCNMKIKYTKGVIMPQYDSTKLIVQMKALARTESMPIDSTEVWDSLSEAQSYINEANAYAGQTIKALVNGKYKTYTLQPSGGGYTLEEVGAVSQSDLKQYVQVVEQLPSSGQQQGVIYIVGTTGQIWTGSAWKVVFKEVSTQVDQLTTKVTQLEGEINKKAPINNPVFTGKVMVGSDEVAVKSYVDGLISNLVSSAPGVVDGDHPLPVDGYKAGQTWRVALAGTYAGQKCEVGDLIICIKDFNTQTNNSDFMVVQANIDGAVTSTATTSTVGEIVVFNAATGKVIKGSGVNISSLNDTISKAHTHANKAILDTYNKNQTQLLADAAITAQGKVDALKVEVDKKANKATTLAGYGITDAYTEAEIDAKLKTITDNVNTKVDTATVDSKINTAKGEIETAYNLAITEKLAARVGSIPEDTDIKTYVDTAVGSGGTASAEAIAKAKQEAINASKAYTESQLQVTEF